jgi:hypothetical protein
MSTNTNTNTFTVTNAKYLGSKVAADLYQMQQFYGKPSMEEIDDYVDEVVTLMKDGYLRSIDYGFRKNGVWVFALSYEISSDGSVDDNPGRLAFGADISGATWYSYLRTNSKFANLSGIEQQKIKDSIAIKRDSATDPQIGTSSQYDRSYSSGNVDLNRKTIK